LEILLTIPQAEIGIVREKESIMFVKESRRRLFGYNRQEQVGGSCVICKFNLREVLLFGKTEREEINRRTRILME
jgi:hypothetical protein